MSHVCKTKEGPKKELLFNDIKYLKIMMDSDWPLLVAGTVLDKAAELRRNSGKYT
jgi:hypothetical protein